MDPYKVLRIPQGSIFDVAKQAYKRLAKLCHPDRPVNQNRTELAGEEFKKISAAWRTFQEKEVEKSKKPKLLNYLTCQHIGCGRVFRSTGAKSQHRFDHLLKVTCPGCPLKFNRPDSLRRHQTKYKHFVNDEENVVDAPMPQLTPPNDFHSTSVAVNLMNGVPLRECFVRLVRMEPNVISAPPANYRRPSIGHTLKRKKLKLKKAVAIVHVES